LAFRFVLPRADVGRGLTPSSGARLSFLEVGTAVTKTNYSDFALTIANTDPVIADGNGVFGDIFLGSQTDVILRDGSNVNNGDGVLIWGPETVYPPDDSISALAASVVSVLDVGGNYTATDVEAVLIEIASDYMRRNRAETISGTKTFSGADINMADNVIIRPEMRDFSLTSNSIASASGVLTIDLTTGNDFYTTLTENVSSIVINNPSPTGKKCSFILEITQDGASGAYTVAQPASVIVPGGGAPTISTGNNAVDELTYRTRDAGTTWKLDFSQAYS